VGIIEEVRQDREDLARVLKKHTGIRKLVEDLYPDSAHFIYELLQNAEDTGATEAIFRLEEKSLFFEHNGRAFEPQDIYAITDIGEGTKGVDDDKIGQFGIGFKAVFAYSETPYVWSPKYSFKISELVLPTAIEGKSGSNTYFEFPFNNPKKTPEDAYDEIKIGLDELAETTLLFLSNIESVHWKIGGQLAGEVLRIEHSPNHIEVLKQLDSKETTNSHFLRFSEPVWGLKNQEVAIAFELDFLPSVISFKSSIPLDKQLKIVPATLGRVAVFFPAVKETSGLRFHLHGPFVPELSRASIKETSANNPLFEQIAELSASSLYSIRDLKLLTGEFLGVLPNLQDAVLKRYEPLRAAIIAEMNNNPLTPTYFGKKHLPAKHLLQAKASLKRLLSAEDLKFLMDHDDVTPQWAIGAPQKSTNMDRFLSGLAIKDWGLEIFVKMLQSKTTEEVRYLPSSYRAIIGQDTDFMKWLGSKNEEWHQRLYALLHDEFLIGHEYKKKQLIAKLKPLRIIQISDGSHAIGSKSYFPTTGLEFDKVFPRVAMKAYSSGKNKNQKAAAYKFLEDIGVSEVGEADQVGEILKQRYTKEENTLTNKTYSKDLKRFISVVEKDLEQAKLFEPFFIFRQQNGKWCCPGEVYLDNPFLNSDLRVYYNLLGDDASRTELSDEYCNMGIDLKRLKTFAVNVGVQTKMELSEVSCSSNSEKKYLHGKYRLKRTHLMIDRDWYFPLVHKVINSKNIYVSRLIWRTMCCDSENKLEAVFRWNATDEARRAPSLILNWLSRRAWVPLTDGRFVRPQEASRELLLEGFPFDENQTWLKEIRFEEDVRQLTEESQKKKAAAKDLLGTDDPNLVEDAKWFAGLSDDDRRKFKVEYQNQHTSDLPEHEPRNSELRTLRVGEQAANAPERTNEQRMRNVSTGLGTTKQEAEMYLRQQYTNNDGEMICQVCKKKLPFKLSDGNYYVEKVELLKELQKRHAQNYLALCPNHAAMFQHANGSRELLKDMIIELDSNHLEVVLANEDSSIYFTKTHVTDMKAIIAVDAEEN